MAYAEWLLRESPPADHPTLSERRPERNFFDFIVLNDRSSQTIVKSKISNHLVVPMGNGSKNKFKGSILTL